MRLNYYGTLKYVKVMAENTGLGVVFHDEEITPHTDGRSLHVQRPNALWSEPEWIDWFYTVLHEIGHETPNRRDWPEIHKKYKIHHKSFFGAINNLFSDYGQERDQYGVYTGRDEYLSKGRAQLMEPLLEKQRLSENEYENAWEALFVWDAMNRESWMPDLIGMGGRGKSNLSPPQLEYLDKLLSSKLDVKVLVNEEATVQFSRDVMEVLGFDPEQEEKDSQEAYDKASEEEEGNGEEGEGEEGKGSQEASEEGEEGKGKQPAKGSFEVDYDKLLAHKHDKEEGKSYSDLHINYKDKSYGEEYQPRDARVVDLPKGLIPSELQSVLEGTSGYAPRLQALQVGNGLPNKVKRLLQVLSQSRWHHSQRSGKLSTKNLYKVNKSIAASAVFKRKDENFLLDTAVTVLGDFSGSMGGQKIVHSMKAMLMLNEAIGKLNVPLEMLGFTDDYNGPVHYIFKHFNSKVSSEILEGHLLKGSNHLSCNADGESIMWAFERLAAQRKKRKILIVLSDGSPAANGEGDCYAYTKKVIKEIEDKTPIEIYGLGIMDDNVLDLYKHSSVINGAEELERELINVIQHKILGKS
jgi:hypothetical protein